MPVSLIWKLLKGDFTRLPSCGTPYGGSVVVVGWLLAADGLVTVVVVVLVVVVEIGLYVNDEVE